MPAFTEDNIRSSLISAASQADEFFARGLYQMFCDRARGLKTNEREPFRLPRKVIWGSIVDQWMVKYNGLRVRYEAEQRLTDLDRVFRALAG